MFRKVILAASVLFCTTAFADDSPSLHQVYEAAQAGRLDDAQKMMDKVLAAHPDSGKAHFVEAEILAKEGRRADAAAELGKAERLAPGLPFAKPEAVQELRSIVAGGQARARGGFPWGMLFLGLGAIFVIYYLFRSRFARNTYIPAGAAPGGYAPGYAPPGYAPGYGPAGGGMGSGILSGLATGAAIGAGMVAGEEIAHHFMDGNQQNSGMSPVSDSWSDNMGGQDFGVADSSSWDDNSGFFADNSGSDWS